jgi:hypothetical protein
MIKALFRLNLTRNRKMAQEPRISFSDDSFAESSKFLKYKSIKNGHSISEFMPKTSIHYGIHSLFEGDLRSLKFIVQDSGIPLGFYRIYPQIFA